MIKHNNPKQLEKERVYFCLQASGHALSFREVMAETHGRKLEAGTSEAKPWRNVAYGISPHG